MQLAGAALFVYMRDAGLTVSYVHARRESAAGCNGQKSSLTGTAFALSESPIASTTAVTRDRRVGARDIDACDHMGVCLPRVMANPKSGAIVRLCGFNPDGATSGECKPSLLKPILATQPSGIVMSDNSFRAAA